MKEERVIRWLGVICFVAGISRMGMTPSSLIWGTDSRPELICGLIASILMSIGTIVFYLVQSKETRKVGLVTVIAMILGNVATVVMIGAMLGSMQAEGVVFMVMRLFALVGLTGGTLAFTFITFRAKRFPKWIPALLILMLVSMVLPVEDNKYFAFFWGLAYVGMGYVIVASKLKPTTSLPASYRSQNIKL
ncbi:hypothetical protein [Paenibacillus hexagrammi]|uniref:Uncharacterized protein n=1 Tax=Paenibacillus hexagrammi TaxID=2908839 RepID=A0ABY3SRJ4_9BACL|nr:hypothetical protein [Paenibacillus sp. YPD9-1]UJF35725.1 hypothetical protein L0M14_11900 [Paenibacillus sp. YPD9-1]